MAQRNRLTNSSDETEIASLISGDSIFAIPYFQRPYKWKPERLKQLNDDILDLVDESTDTHFLGAVIVHGRRSNPSEPDIYDVIDGQQRITTIFLYLCACVKTLSSHGEYTEAVSLFQKYLVINRETSGQSNLKLQCSKDDRAELNNIFVDLIADRNFKDRLGGFKLKLLPLGSTSGNSVIIRNNYRLALKFLKESVMQGGLDRLRSIYQALLELMSVVQIDVRDPTNGPKIFDSLNSRQEPMTVGDLIRNEIFGRVASEHPSIIEQVDADYWQPFYKRFNPKGRNLFDLYFFPYGLIKNPSLKKSEVYSALRKDWDGEKDPEIIIKQLSQYQDIFLDLQCGTNFSNHPKPLAAAFRRLFDAGLPASSYPFLMQLSNAVTEQVITWETATEILELLESFFVRRAVCGIEPTGLHAVFKKLWADCGGDYTRVRINQEIRKHTTVLWPDDDMFGRAIASRPLYKSNVTKFIILEFDREQRGDTPENVSWIEHVLPVTPEESWFSIFTKDEHERLKDCLANLLPLSSQMNINLGNKPYELKRGKYRSDSMFKSTRMFAETIEGWNPQTLAARAGELELWAIERWRF